MSSKERKKKKKKVGDKSSQTYSNNERERVYMTYLSDGAKTPG